MYKIELIRTGEVLDVGEESIIRSNFSSFDLSKLDKVNTDFTNTFELPMTQNNKAVLSGLGATGSTSNMPYIYSGVNLKYKGNTLVDSGSIIVHSVNYDKNTYSTTIVGQDATFYKIVDGLEVADVVKEFDIVYNLNLWGEVSDLIYGTHPHSDKISVSLAMYSDSSITSYNKSDLNTGFLYNPLYENENVEDFFKSGNHPSFFDIDLSYVRPQISVRWLLDSIFNYVGYSYSLPDIGKDMDELVLNTINQSEERELAEDTPTDQLKDRERGYTNLWEVTPELKVTDLLKDVVSRFNLNLVVNEVSKEVSLEFWDDVLGDTDNAIDWTEFASSKNKEEFSSKGLGVRNIFRYKDSDSINEVFEKDGGRYASDLTEIRNYNVSKDFLEGALLLNNVNVELERNYFTSELNRPLPSTQSNTVLNFQRRKDADTLERYNVFGRIRLNGRVYKLANVFGHTGSVYKNKEVGDDPIIFRRKVVANTARVRFIESLSSGYWDYIIETQLSGISHYSRYHAPFFGDKYVTRGADGRTYFGDLSIDWREVKDYYGADNVFPLYEKRLFFMFDARFIGSNVILHERDDGIYMKCHIMKDGIGYDEWLYIGITQESTLDEVDRPWGSLRVETVEYGEDIGDNNYKAYIPIEGSELNLSQVPILVSDEIGWDYYLDNYYGNLKGVFSNYNLQEWTAKLPPHIVANFNFDKLIYLEQEQAYFYVNKISDYDPLTGLCTLSLTKIFGLREGLTPKYFTTVNNKPVVLFVDENNRVFNNSHSFDNLKFLDVGTILKRNRETWLIELDNDNNTIITKQ